MIIYQRRMIPLSLLSIAIFYSLFFYFVMALHRKGRHYETAHDVVLSDELFEV